MQCFKKQKNIFNFSSKIIKYCLKLLVFGLITSSLFVTACTRIHLLGSEPEHEARAEANVKSMIQAQEKYFLKHKTFFKPPDKPLKPEPSFFDAEQCYGYYTKTSAEVNLKIPTNGVYSYARQQACGGNWGIELSSYIGGVFVIPIDKTKQLKMVSIICKGLSPGYAPLYHRPDYINGVIDCLPNTTKVYSQTVPIK